ncbi:MAG TPA: flagellar basal body L-ring protein FlgH [Nevskia sp.]|nr:flagellar basal body L-ring protein FlgH [Nevskia sp.]
MTGRLQWYLAALLLLSGGAWAGGLYHADTYSPLTSDTRSFKVGDALTVMIVEAASAETDAASSQSRDFKLTAGLQGSHTQNTVGASLNRQGDNSGTTSRNGKLQAEITVRVQAVSANGDLVVHGGQSITVNGETQHIGVSGVVRPIDVSADNVVLSTRLSNAQIDYAGKGFVDRSQDEGFIARLFDFLGL